MQSRTTRLVPALFVLLWATGFIGARYAMPWAEPFSFLAVRFLLAFLILVLVVAIFKSRALKRNEALHAIFAGTLIHGAYLGGVFWAIHHGMPAGLSALIMGLQPLITAVFAGMVLGERILPRHWIGLAVGFAGVVIVLLPKLGEVAGGVTSATLAASLVAVLSISAGTLWQKKFVSNADLVTGTLYQYLGATCLMAVFSFAFEAREFELTGELVFAMAWLVLVLSIGAIFLLMYLIREGEISKVTSLFYLVPAVTAVIAWVLFDEKLTLVQIFGMAVTAVGVALATQAGTRARASR
ncbi:DMT family transporter [Aquamicrobium sp. LC103]|uniref:DMT family transporter n=1 Tax=Aquamicrobium sp. LC103 TaxID=1120658 RepID=UPI00063EB37E|nr:DMT family transporter [Aquamicrobium sp. LC103]TKT75254.1 DMT family transporter [Aquamicrobium sp. LC103]